MANTECVYRRFRVSSRAAARERVKYIHQERIGEERKRELFDGIERNELYSAAKHYDSPPFSIPLYSFAHTCFHAIDKRRYQRDSEKEKREMDKNKTFKANRY